MAELNHAFGTGQIPHRMRAEIGQPGIAGNRSSTKLPVVLDSNVCRMVPNRVGRACG